MKILISLFTIAAFLFFASCSKDASLSTEDAATRMGATWNTIELSDSSSGATTRSTVLQITVSKVLVQQISATLVTDLSSNYDLTGVILEDTQYLRFEDASGNESLLTFTVNNYLGDNGTLDVNFAIGGNDLTGLTLKTTQDIIIEDDLVN